MSAHRLPPWIQPVPVFDHTTPLAQVLSDLQQHKASLQTCPVQRCVIVGKQPLQSGSATSLGPTVLTLDDLFALVFQDSSWDGSDCADCADRNPMAPELGPNPPAAPAQKSHRHLRLITRDRPAPVAPDRSPSPWTAIGQLPRQSPLTLLTYPLSPQYTLGALLHRRATQGTEYGFLDATAQLLGVLNPVQAGLTVLFATAAETEADGWGERGTAGTGGGAEAGAGREMESEERARAGAVRIDARADSAAMLGGEVPPVAALANQSEQWHGSQPSPTIQTLTAHNIALSHLTSLKDQILMRVSHELKSPVTAILGLSTLLKDPETTPIDPTHRYYAQLIHHSGQQLMAIVNDVLDLTRLETQHLTLSPREVAVAEICEQAKDQALAGLDQGQQLRAPSADRSQSPDLGGGAPGPAVTYHLDLPSDLPRLRADPLRLRQMLYHLLHNAFKFTPPGGAVVLQVRPWGDRWLALTVVDTGAGIAPVQQRSLLQATGEVALDGRSNRERMQDGSVSSANGQLQAHVNSSWQRINPDLNPRFSSEAHAWPQESDSPLFSPAQVHSPLNVQTSSQTSSPLHSPSSSQTSSQLQPQLQPHSQFQSHLPLHSQPSSQSNSPANAPSRASQFGADWEPRTAFLADSSADSSHPGADSPPVYATDSPGSASSQNALQDQPLTAGAGLGLLLTQRLARIHGGDLSFRSQRGQGSAFTLLLPREARDVEESGEWGGIRGQDSWGQTGEGTRPGRSIGSLLSSYPAFASASTASAVTSPSRRSSSLPRLAPVLVAAQDPDVIEHLSQILEQLGCDGLIARSQAEALDKLRRFNPGLVLVGSGLRGLLHQPWAGLMAEMGTDATQARAMEARAMEAGLDPIEDRVRTAQDVSAQDVSVPPPIAMNMAAGYSAGGSVAAIQDADAALVPRCRVVAVDWQNSPVAEPASCPSLRLPLTPDQLRPYLTEAASPSAPAPPQRLTLLCLRADAADDAMPPGWDRDDRAIRDRGLPVRDLRDLLDRHVTPGIAPMASPRSVPSLPAQLPQVLPQYRILEAHDLEQAELLSCIWQPHVLLLDTSACPDAPSYVQALPTYDRLRTLPLITLDTATTAAANHLATQLAHQGLTLAVFPCLVLETDPQLSLEQLAGVLDPVIQVAAACGVGV